MSIVFAAALQKIIIPPASILAIGISINTAFAQKNYLYSPIPLNSNIELTDTLSINDIPTGQGGFARDYTVKLNKGDNLAIDLSSENFDSIITLLAPDGSTVSENDDGPDGTSNSLLFARINETGTYIVRVRSFGETGVGTYKLKVTKLQPVK
ncbi:PPC domain-containing protein [Anabaena cylindrica FACHB-243]|uniref:Peptidase domain protein n=1 Tax=Anabaena cylindrica (strain ATCC 27899 / PCC 7122) TaxID=272123 RepID=K9ZKE8_ANACC|nr:MULTISPECIES: PPC domain-containing protein [Anabaena]AFZ59042.1 peptidase domain protein [Anabaena cylindrica PCC 7122]MBD2420618.1 PPC domain-containing protein [Anabaena cylindrica FACHB-243]MBY5285518.1 peptidase [Anabaena sp. CCAP 1446/1C]MBY5309391.1 peptidase [Anabaena sp. CCAP 1446/1C]MCM2408577.1 PPC domain-containing protein [Anabaena sp. CCAP 1446/1C]